VKHRNYTKQFDKLGHFPRLTFSEADRSFLHDEERDGSWWAPRSSKPLSVSDPYRGWFNSFPLRHFFIFSELRVSDCRDFRRFSAVASAEYTNKYK